MLAVLTLAGGRDAQLAHLAAGLDAGDQPPDELVVADLGGRSAIPRAEPFEIRAVALDVTGGLPLAEARNTAAGATEADQLVFLDVDCVPEPGMVAGYAAALDAFDGIVMGGVRYGRPGELPPGGEPHPVRPLPPPGVTPTDRYDLFWSLSFAIRRERWEQIGGFDPGYRGYGAEDTDFAFSARAAGVPLAWTGGAECFHLHHPQQIPPVDRLDAVVANARRFHGRWGEWPFPGWLRQMADEGHVLWERDRLEILR